MNDDLILRIAGRGEGVTGDGRHIAFAAPGDRIAADGGIIPGPHHNIPPCRHFPKCGGCQLQHVDDEGLRDFVVARIVGALHAQGIDTPPMRPTHLSPPQSRRRVSLRAERKGKRITIGFNEARSHAIVDLRQCDVMAPQLFALIEPLRGLLVQLIGDRKAAAVQMTLTDRGIDLLLEKVTVDGLAASEALTDFAQRYALARVSIDQGYGPEPRWEPEPATVTLGHIAVPLPVGAFLQATADGETILVDAVREIVGDAATTADLFAGLGTFALALPGRVLAAEGARDAALALKSAATRGQRFVAVDHRDLFRRPVTQAELARFDAIVLDPPRAGAREQIDELAASTVKRIAYVSCNPATFARDAKILIDGGWTLDWIQPVGQFRWSTHVELVAAFARVREAWNG